MAAIIPHPMHHRLFQNLLVPVQRAPPQQNIRSEVAVEALLSLRQQQQSRVVGQVVSRKKLKLYE